MNYDQYIPKFTSRFLQNGSLQFESSTNTLAHVEISSWESDFKPKISLPGRKLREDEKLHILKGIVLINERHLAKKELPVHKFIKQIPENIIDECISHSYLQLYVLRALHAFPDGLDLLQTNRVLFYLKIHQAIETGFEQWLKFKCQNELSQKRTNILSEIFSTSFSEKYVHLLTKINEQKITYDVINSVKQLLNNADLVKKVSHLEQISVALIDELTEFPFLIITPHIHEICHNLDEKSLDMILICCHIQRDIWGMEYPDKPDIVEPLSRVKNQKQLIVLHDRVQHGLLLHKKKELSTEIFCEPPISGIQGKIEPITNAYELYKESDIQKNCVVSFTPNPHCFFYKLLFGERCTIRITYDPGQERFVLNEIKATCNQEAESSSIKFVNNWLAEKQHGANISFDIDRIYSFVIDDMQKHKYVVRFRERYSVERLEYDLHLQPHQAEELHQLLIDKGHLVVCSE